MLKFLHPSVVTTAVSFPAALTASSAPQIPTWCLSPSSSGLSCQGSYIHIVYVILWLFCVFPSIFFYLNVVSSAYFFLTHLKKQQLVLSSFGSSRLLFYFIQITQLFTCHLSHGLHMGKNLLGLFSCLCIHVK